MRKHALLAVIAAGLLIWTGCQKQDQAFEVVDGDLVRQSPLPGDVDFDDHDHELASDEAESMPFVVPLSCKHASSAQLKVIKEGNAKYDSFMRRCWAATSNSRWCEQVARPNPASRSTFICTYGQDLPHRLIHQDESTWKYAFAAVRLVQELEGKGLSIALIYNWWRPEPYNANVGGAAGRHPFGTSVDVRFASLSHMEKGHAQLCKWRKAGRLRALGYYGSTGLHFGIGDLTANTWGKSCP